MKYLIYILIFVSLTFSQDVYRLNDSTFVYPCITTAGTDFNFVGLPLETDWTMASDLDPAGVNIDAISRWDPVLQAWETAGFDSSLGWCKDFSVETGGAYMISAKNDFDFIVTGDSVDVTYDLITTDGRDLNTILLPINKSELLNTQLLGNDISLCNQIMKFDISSQSWVASDSSIFGWLGVFPVEVGMPLFVNILQSRTWPNNKMRSDIVDNIKNISEKNKGATFVPRIVFFHLQDHDGNEFDFPREGEFIKPFTVYIGDSYSIEFSSDIADCGFTMIDGLSVAYLNLGNLPDYFWEIDDVLRFYVEWCITDYSKNSKCFINEYSTVLDNSSSPIFLGFESLIPGSGAPLQLNTPMYVRPLSEPPEIVVIDSIATLEWNANPYMCYKLYASDDPYSGFVHQEWIPMGISSYPIGFSDKQFYYLTTIGAWEYPWYKK